MSVKKTLETFEELGNCPSDYISGDGGKISWVALEIIALELLGKKTDKNNNSQGRRHLVQGTRLVNLPINPKIPVVKRRRKQKIPRITTVKNQRNGTEDPVGGEGKKRGS